MTVYLVAPFAAPTDDHEKGRVPIGSYPPLSLPIRTVRKRPYISQPAVITALVSVKFACQSSKQRAEAELGISDARFIMRPGQSCLTIS